MKALDIALLPDGDWSSALPQVRSEEQKKKETDSHECHQLTKWPSSKPPKAKWWPNFGRTSRPKTVENFKKLRQTRILRRHRVSSRHQRLHDPGRRPLTKDTAKKAAGARVIRATKSKRNSTTNRTIAACFPWRDHPIRTPPAASFSSATATRYLDHQYTAFGKLIKGDDVLEKDRQYRSDDEWRRREQQADQAHGR